MSAPSSQRAGCEGRTSTTRRVGGAVDQPHAARARGHDLDLAAPFHPALLHGEDVGEVGVAAQGQLDAGRREAVVLDLEVLAHAVADAAPPDDDHVGIRVAAGRTAPPHEGGRERVLLVDGEGLDAVAVEPQLPDRQHPAVQDEQPVRQVLADVTGPTGEAEGLPLDQGDPSGLVAQRRHGRRALEG